MNKRNILKRLAEDGNKTIKMIYDKLKEEPK